MSKNTNIAVVIPSYKVSAHILSVLEKFGALVSRIYVVDDACPEDSGKLVERECKDPRVKVLFHKQNKGVGGACLTGMREAVRDGADIIVKIDGDGQMDPALIPQFVYPIEMGLADYSKGNRYFSLNSMAGIPTVRKFGNLGLSFMTKLSSGYYHVFDPCNGYFAIHSGVVNLLEEDKIAHRYFFESDMLFNLSILGATICDIPMKAVYGDEKSSLVVSHAIPEFFFKNVRNFFKRVFYNYYLRDFNPASLALFFGALLTLFGFVFGIVNWRASIATNSYASAGTVMLAAVPLLLGFGLLALFMSYDFSRQNSIPLQKRILLERKTS